MDHVDIDVHTMEAKSTCSPRAVRSSNGAFRTEPERVDAVLGPRPRARILIEASTDREWVARCLEALGPEVIVADPNALRSAYPPRSQMGARKRTREEVAYGAGRVSVVDADTHCAGVRPQTCP